MVNTISYINYTIIQNLGRSHQLSKQYNKSKKGKGKNTENIADTNDTADGESSVTKSKGIITVKEKTPEERKQNHIDGIIKTVVASVIGIVAGFISFKQFGTAEDTTWYAILTIVAVLAYYAQRIIFPAIKINSKEFGFKDWFYVEFLVIDFCLVTWTLLLN